MIRRPPRSTLTDTLFPYTTLCRSCSFLFAASSDSSPITTSIRLASPKLIRSILDMLCSHRQPVFHACQAAARAPVDPDDRSEEHTSELQSLMRISYAVFCLKKKKQK